MINLSQTEPHGMLTQLALRYIFILKPSDIYIIYTYHMSYIYLTQMGSGYQTLPFRTACLTLNRTGACNKWYSHMDASGP